MPIQPNVKLAARRARLLGSVTFIVGLWPFLPAVAQSYDGCTTPQNGGSSCTVPSGAGTTGVSVVDTGTYWDDYPYNLTNDADITATTANQSVILHLELDGSAGTSSGGTDDATAYSGGALALTNNGDITLQGGGGNWGQVDGIFVQANGGAGARPGNNGDDGGRGGDSGTINLINNGTITIDASAGSSRPTVTGIYAGASAGAGGDMNSGAGDQKGGNSGDAKTVTITNNGAIQIGAEGSAFTGDGGGHAIYAYGDGSNGGSENGEGGAGGTISVTNNAAISLYWNGTDSAPQGVHGIYARSQGGNGIVSGDNSDPGGKGESGRPITLTTNGDITIESSGGTPTGPSAAMYAISQGGDGGAGPDNDHDGGAGGGASINSDGSEGITTITVQDFAAISASGAGIMGVAARSLGGNGGDGSDGTSGGAGGYGGVIQINLDDYAAITTDGDEGYAVLGQSVGGIGGGNASTAGAGGDGGNVGVYASSVATITTHGDHAAGVTLHSIGGGGGVGGDFTNVLAGDGGDGGNGGDAGKVEITSGADVTTYGQYAHGLLVQSIGGSGGAGGVGAGLIIALGGQGGEGGDGENVIANNTGAVTTSGYGANGIVAQTLSGGGGAAGAAGGAISIGGNAGAGANNSATAYVTNNNDVTTTGDAAVGIIVQSIGGGGGTGAGAAGIASVGGSGGAGGSAGIARIFHVGGTVSTSGEFSHGLVAQSIGGGGGSGGNVIDLSVGIGLGVGGSGSGGGYGGHACVSNTYDGCDYTDSDGNHVDGNPSDDGSKAPAPSQPGSTIITLGDFSVGAIAQSIGGGGGNGGTAMGAGALDVVSLQIGGAGGAGLDGRPALMTFDNLTLTTKGNNAPGLLTQSIGGGGGNGGSANSVDVEDILPVQVGGSGGSGGSGVQATTELSGGHLTTIGAHSSAIVAQSIGGGGGNGGSAAGFNTSAGLGINTSVGASGGSGGSGGTVSVDIVSTAISTGIDENGKVIDGVTDSHGVVAQSIGGGGGNGGTSVADAMTVAFPGSEVDLPPFAASITTSVGGKGGVAGAGGMAAVTLSGSTHVQTGGDGSIGVLAQSIAHGGGNGGSASSFSGTIGDLDTVSSDISTAVGNAGGAGGNTGAASLALNDTAWIHTVGDHSNAVVVQSIGGGGGNGGVGSASNDQIGGGFNLSANIGLGGKGGTGGTPGSATVHLEDGTGISTTGSGSRGVLAQSIGGGGGTGQGGTIGLSGSASVGGGDGEGEEVADDDGGDDEGPISGSVNVNIGSETGDGMTGGTVSVTANGSITTTGGDADGILAQSIGGSGGLAGSVGNDAGSDEDGFGGGDEETNYTLTASLGGAGGTGGTGGEVDVIIEKGHVTTTGDWADGVVAQSIGGGGGAGGTSTAAGSDATANIDLAIGGHGGAGGDGGAVNATFADPDGNYVVSTSGFAAHGVLLQSIGGGGGQGGDGSDSASGGITVGGGIGGSAGSSGNGGVVAITSGSALTALTQGHDSHALVAQSIGGGGGIGGAGSSTASEDDDSHSLDLSVGGSGASSGNGGTVELDFIAPWSGIQTMGDRSYGVLAQSIGGGGGLGGGGSSNSVASLTVGGSGGAAGDGEAVTLSVSGTLHTAGMDAHGIVAQSIGGGGGIGGAGTVTEYTPLKFGGQDGASGDGGDVALHLSGLSITTEGNGAHAIIAQSIGGGGGIAGNTGGSVNASDYIGSDSSGSGRSVLVNVNGNINTHGDRAHGIVAQSIGGGGGIYSVSGSSETIYGSTASSFDGTSASDDVTFSQSGTLTTNGAGSIGIFAQSASINGATSSDFMGTITGTVNGTVTGGTGAGAAAIYVIDGKNNTLTVSGTGYVEAGDSDAWSIYYFGNSVNDYSKLDVTIEEGGTVSDNIYLSAGIVTNNSNNSLIGASLYEADIVNNGRLVVGDEGAGHDLRITRDLTQSAAGTIVSGIDFEQPGRSDSLLVEGDAALAGGIHLDTETLVRDVEVGVLNVEGNLTGSIDAIDSPAVDFSARTLDKEIRVKAIDSRFANAFDRVSDNQREAGRHLDAIFDAGSGRYAELLGGINMLSSQEDGGASYAAALSSLSPGGSQAAAAAQATLAAGRLDGALRCPTYSGEATSRSGESCLWAEAGGADIQQDGLPGYDGTVWGLGAGGQVAFGDNWFAGGAVGYEDSRFDGTDGLTSADGGTGYLAAALGRRFGDFTLSAAVAGSYGSFDTGRSLFLPGFSGTAEGNTDVTTLSARLRAAYTLGTERAYLRPSVDLDVVYTHASGYAESGAGIYNLDVSSQEQTAFIATPAVEIGGSTPLKGGWHMGGFASAGVSFSSEDAWETDATLAATPDGAGTFRTTLPIADMVAKLRAGVSFVNESNDLEIKLEYDGAFGDDYSSHGGLLRLSKRF